MGGRGASSASGKSNGSGVAGGINQGGLRIEWPDGTTQTLYFDSKDGTNYWIGNPREGFAVSTFEQVPEEIPGNLSKAQLKRNAEKNGARVTEISAKERDSMEKKRREERKDMPDYETGTNMGNDKGARDMRREIRMGKIGRRAGNRRR